MKKRVIFILFLVLILVGCSADLQEKESVDKNIDQKASNEENKKPEFKIGINQGNIYQYPEKPRKIKDEFGKQKKQKNDEAKILKELEEMIKKSSEAKDIMDFMDVNISKLSKENSSKMLDRVLIYLEAIKYKYEINIYDKKVSDTIKNVFGNDLNNLSTKQLKFIEDEWTKDFFENIIKGGYKINNYSEYMLMEIDYDKLGKYSIYLNDETKRYIDIERTAEQDKRFAWLRGNIDNADYLKHIIETEDYLRDYPDGTYANAVRELNREKMSYYFIGGEGYSVFDYSSGKIRARKLKEISFGLKRYPMSGFSELGKNFMTELERNNFRYSPEYYTLLSNYKIFGIDSNMYIKKHVEEIGNHIINYPQLYGMEDLQIQDNINQMIKDELFDSISKIQEDFRERETIETFYYLGYSGTKYLSMEFQVLRKYENKYVQQINRPLNIDLTTGEELKLFEIFDVEEEKAKEVLDALIEEKANVIRMERGDRPEVRKICNSHKDQTFFMTGMHVVLYYGDMPFKYIDEEYPVYIYCKYEELADIMDIRKIK